MLSPDGGAFSLHQNGDGEIRMSEVAFTISTNSNASGRNTPLIYDSRGNGGVQYVRQSQATIKTE